MNLFTANTASDQTKNKAPMAAYTFLQGISPRRLNLANALHAIAPIIIEYTPTAIVISVDGSRPGRRMEYITSDREVARRNSFKPNGLKPKATMYAKCPRANKHIPIRKKISCVSCHINTTSPKPHKASPVSTSLL